jgi:hypothetical protein
MNKNLIINLIFIFSLAIVACEKDEYITSSDSKLVFSQDTILFDTIFATIGSITKQFTVQNPYNKNINISSIKLAGNSDSPYRLNIDGFSGNILNNIEIRKKDSIYIFVEITVDPSGSNSPLIIQDSIIFSFNGTQQDVDLIAFGQDVHMIDNEIIGNENWIADKPYLIYNSMWVDTNKTLTIASGTMLHFHKNSRLFVAGTIVANGTFDMPIIFQGDRLETDYDEIPGQWDGIWLMAGSKDNIFNFTEIKNAVIGIQVDTLANIAKPTLQLTNSKITNMTSVGLYAQGSTIYAFNNLIANCGQFTIALTIGGSYEFYHSTIANYWKYSTRTSPSVLLKNYYEDINNITQVRPIERATFSNCIIYGRKNNELIIDKIDGTTLNYSFKNTLLQVGSDFTIENPEAFTDVIFDTDPKFKDWENGDFELDTLSIAKDIGNKDIGNLFPLDINQNKRNMDLGPDLGAFERIENQ